MQWSKIKNKISLSDIRKRACKNNLISDCAQKFLPLLICPLCKSSFKVSKSYLNCLKGHKVPINNGFPDFVVFSKNAMEEKMVQADFHDDEENNETFEEIVIRPYNGNSAHVASWLYHLNFFETRLPVQLGLGLKGTTILNCGCGGGFEAEFLAERGAQVVGFDISKLRVEAAATRLHINNYQSMFYRGDASTLPFPDNTFDLVLYHDSLHHIPIEEIPPAIEEAARVARVGVVMLEANDSPFRMLLETLGLSKSIERAGNYVFRFKKNLMKYWARKYSMTLVDYSVLFTKKEHRPRFYAIPIAGKTLYRLVRLAGILLKPVGNEVCIMLKKSPALQNVERQGY
jgi:ubiquinone/menaquinone biosynthesis C-methylase UbiE